MLQLTRSGAAWRAPEADLAALADAFSARHCVRLRGFVEPALLRLIQSQIARARFRQRTHDGIGTDQTMEANACAGLLHFLVNDARVYGLVETLSGCRPIRSFHGRVYRRLPGRHHDAWHTDLIENRRVGLSINLSAAAYEGGAFEIRDARTERPFDAIADVGTGDAVLFRIAPGLEHRVTELHGTSPRTAFAGWFRAKPDYLGGLRAEWRRT